MKRLSKVFLFYFFGMIFCHLIITYVISHIPAWGYATLQQGKIIEWLTSAFVVAFFWAISMCAFLLFRRKRH